MAETLPGLLAEHAERTPRGVALRQKRLGIWQEVTWSAHWEGVQRVAVGLSTLGLRPEDAVALSGGHRVQWLQAELGIQLAGGTTVPLIAEATPAELASALKLANARFAIVEGEEQADKLRQVRGDLPALEMILYWDPRGMRTAADPWLRPLWEVTGEAPPAAYLKTLSSDLSPAPSPCGRGEPHATTVTEGTPFPGREGGRGVRSVGPGVGATLQPDTVAEIVISPGIGGTPRAVRLTHANLIAAARALVETERLDQRSELVSFAPQGWIGDRLFATATALVAGYPVNLPEEAETVLHDIQEIGPRLIAAPPIFWERLESLSRARGDAAGRVRRALYRGAAGLGGPRLPGPIGEFLVRRPVRDHLGLLRVRHAYAAGGPLPETTARFFRAIGVPLKQLYTVTAASGAVAVGDTNAGRPLPGFELQLAAGGEVVVRGAGVAGAYQADAAPVTSPDGWLHTGDLGRMEPDGSLTLFDRIDDVARLADGTEVAPSVIERRLTGSPYVRRAVVVAAGRPSVAALIEVDGAAVNAWAEHHGMSVTTYQELSQHPDVGALVRVAVQDANAALAAPLRVQRFAILDRELSADEGEVTRLYAVRRSIVMERWSALVEALYEEHTASATGPSVVLTDERAVAAVG